MTLTTDEKQLLDRLEKLSNCMHGDFLSGMDITVHEDKWICNRCGFSAKKIFQYGKVRSIDMG